MAKKRYVLWELLGLLEDFWGCYETLSTDSFIQRYLQEASTSRKSSVSSKQLCQLSLPRVGLGLLLQLPSEEGGGGSLQWYWGVSSVRARTWPQLPAPSWRMQEFVQEGAYDFWQWRTIPGCPWISIHRADSVPWLQMRGWELYGIRRKWQRIAENDCLLCRMETHVVWLDLLSREFAACLELGSRMWRDFRGFSGLSSLAPHKSV